MSLRKWVKEKWVDIGVLLKRMGSTNPAEEKR